MTDGASIEERFPWRGALTASVAALLLYVVVPLISIGTDWGLVNYDDPYLVSPENPAIGAGLWSSLGTLLNPMAEPFMDAWLPVYYFSLGIDHALFGDSFFWWHAHSAVLHAIGAWLVVVIAWRLGLRGAAALTAGVVFAVHPAAVESVAWIASRKDQLSFIWGAFAVLLHLRGLRTERQGWHFAGAACLAVALLAKGTAVVVAPMLLVHALLLRPRLSARARFNAVAPFAVVAIGLTVLHLSIARSAGTAGAGTGASFAELVSTNFEVAWLWARTLLIPYTGWLSVEHAVDPFAPSGAAMGAGLVVALLLGYGIVSNWKKRPAVAAGLLAVVVAVAPFNNLFPQTSVLFAERYAYLVLLPLAIGAGVVLSRTLGRIAPWAALVVLGVMAAPRIDVWRDSVALWDDAAQAHPANVFIQMQLADAYSTAAREATDSKRAGEHVLRAEEAWRTARQGAVSAVNNAGDTPPRVLLLRRVQAETGLATHVLVTAGTAENPRERIESAIALFDAAQEALSAVGDAAGRDERAYLVYSNRAAAYEVLGMIDKALADWRAAGRLDPDEHAPYAAMARLYLKAGRRADAMASLAEATRVAPDDPVATRERVELRLAAGDVTGAKRDLGVALDAHPDDVELLLSAARLDLMLMQPLSAADGFRKALDLRPGDDAIRTGLASALLQQAQAFASRGDVEAARKAAAEAADAAPESSAPDQILGIVARRARDLDAAARHFRDAYKAQPDGVRIREALASVLVERAVQLLDAQRAAGAFALLEEAVAVNADALATNDARIWIGVSDWPAPPETPSQRDEVVRQAALRGLAYLAAARIHSAREELLVAEAGSRDADPALRRVVVQLLVRAHLQSASPESAGLIAGELPVLAAKIDGIEHFTGYRELANTLVECGLSLRGTGELDAAADAFARARRAADLAVEAGMPQAKRHQIEGEILFGEELFLDATREFDRAAELAPDDPEPLLDRVAVWRSHFLMEEDPSFLRGAEEDLRAALRIAPSDPRVLAGLGDVLLMSQRPSEAFPWLQRAVLADPSQVHARLLLSQLLVRAGRQSLERHAETRLDADLEAATSACDRALALDAPDPTATLFHADIRRAHGDWEGARAALESARKRFGDDPEVADALGGFYRDLAHGFLLKRREADAVKAFHLALEVEGADIDRADIRERLLNIALAAFKAGGLARQAGDMETAAREFRRCVAADPTPEGWFQLAMCYADAEELEPLRDAASYFANALELKPDFQPARLNRAAVLMRLGRPGDAAVDYQEWLERAPEDDPNRPAVERRLEMADELEKEISEAVKRELGTTPDVPDDLHDPDEDAAE